MKNNPVKQGKVFIVYEKLCGVTHGGSNSKGFNVGDKMSLTQEDIAKELGVDVVPCEIKIYDTDEQVIRDLLETNLRQRGIGNTNVVKFLDVLWS